MRVHKTCVPALSIRTGRDGRLLVDRYAANPRTPTCAEGEYSRRGNAKWMQRRVQKKIAAKGIYTVAARMLT